MTAAGAVLDGSWLKRLLAALALLLCFAMPPTLRAGAQTPRTEADAARVKAHAKEILAQPEFQPESPDSPGARFARSVRDTWGKGARWLSERWSAFRRWLDRLFSGMGGQAAGPVASGVSYVFAVLVIGLAGWLVAWLIRNLWLNRRQREAKARKAYDEAEADDAVELEPSAWIAQAGAYADSSDYRRAFRAVFVAILLLFDERGLIEFERSRTNGDYLRLLRRKNVKPLYDIFDPLVVEFDRRWYGRAETGVEDYIRIQQTFETVRGLLSEPAAGHENVPSAAAPGKA